MSCRNPTHRLRFAGVVLATVALASGLLGGCSSAEVAKQQRLEQADFHYRLANGYFHAGSVDLAIRELISALEIEQSHADSRYLYGFILFGRKRYEEAAEHFRKALQSKPDFYAARNILGATYIELERYYDAVATLEPLTREPRYTTPFHAYNNLGLAYFRQGDLRQAEKNFRMAVFHNPKFCQGYRNLGLVHVAQRDYAAAVEQLTEAVTRCPRYAELHLQRGEALEADRRFDEADKSFQKCADLAGDTPIGRRCKARLRGAAGGGG
ncbi:MAG: tetratricopeptide repeat protein [Deltaproteobacteria bacterium]|nr:tetratricopeptide repeat protein [Deltaproteobacteria bacterium]